MICNNDTSEDCRIIEISHLLGWICCDECIQNGKARNEVIDSIVCGNIIPLGWLFASKFYNPKIYHIELMFYRNSIKRNKYPVVRGELNLFEHERYAYWNAFCDQYIINMAYKNIGCQTLDGKKNEYYDQELSNDKTHEIMRPVTLENIFAHNPDLYDLMINCDNLLSNDYLKISWKELPDRYTRPITAMYREALKKELDSFSL